KINFNYDYNFQYFIESIHWRFLLTQMQLYEGTKLQILKDIEISIRAKLVLQKKGKALVLLKLDNPQYPRWSSHSVFSLDENIITILNYRAIDFKRMVTCDLFFYKKQVYIYSYYCGLIVYSCYNCNKFDLLNLSCFFVRSKGRFKLRSKSFNHVIEHLLTIKYKYIIDSLEKVSDEDREKYQNVIKKAKGIET
ncbi:MAG TPA: hypothetical protein VHT96_10565, partial [Clostridia bacterium]|nr:hypothetical protein [Clostridia bacterium]